MGVAQGRTVRRFFWKSVAEERRNLRTLPLFCPPTGYKREANSQVPGARLDWRWGKNRGGIMLRKALLSTVALVGLTGLANAADLAFKATRRNN
jgi:hypothetical protein